MGRQQRTSGAGRVRVCRHCRLSTCQLPLWWHGRFLFVCVCVGGAGYAGVLTVLGTVGNCREGWGVKRGRCNAF